MQSDIIFQVENASLPIISMTDIAVIKPPYVHFRRQHFEYILYYILSGEMFMTEGEVKYHLKENDFLLLEPTMEHVGRKSSECRFCYVHFSWGELTIDKKDSQDIQTFSLPKHYHIEDIRNAMQCHELAERLVKCFHSKERCAELMAANLFYELLLTQALDYEQKLHKEEVPFQGKAKQIIPELAEYLEQSYASDISGDMIQEKFHYHFDYLNRQFKKWTGETIFVYLNKIRMERAKQMLQTGFYTVEEVALQTGFQNVYYFERVFKKYYGKTPGKMKKISDINS